jgi:hypothetical protein
MNSEEESVQTRIQIQGRELPRAVKPEYGLKEEVKKNSVDKMGGKSRAKKSRQRIQKIRMWIREQRPWVNVFCISICCLRNLKRECGAGGSCL